MSGTAGTSIRAARAKSPAAFTRSPTPNPAGSGGTGAGRKVDAVGRNAGLGVTTTPGNRDDRFAISTNPSVVGRALLPEPGRVLGPDRRDERLRGRVVVGGRGLVDWERGGDVHLVQDRDPGQLPGE